MTGAGAGAGADEEKRRRATTGLKALAWRQALADMMSLRREQMDPQQEFGLIKRSRDFEDVRGGVHGSLLPLTDRC